MKNAENVETNIKKYYQGEVKTEFGDVSKVSTLH